MEVEFPKKLKLLLEPHPGKVAYGGRDGVKSWSFCIALIEMASNLMYWKDLGRTNLRIVCARETQNSIAASVHQLLKDTIERMKMPDRFQITENTIRCTANGSEFIFVGLRHNPTAIKSLEGADILWVEEAQDVSSATWRTVIPTVRKPGSEIWVSFNPQLATDATYVQWVLNPMPGTIVVKTGWEDNRWLSERSRVSIEHLRATDLAEYEHVYGGECKGAVTGAIFAQELKRATDEGRITSVPYNRQRPVDTVWDLGYGDLTAIWFVQAYDGYWHLIDYIDGSGMTIADWLVQLQGKQYLYGVDYLPHDSVDSIIHKRLQGRSDMSIEQLMRQAGRKVRVIPKVLIETRINAARTLFPQVRFDEAKCRDGIQYLRHYQWGEQTDREKQLGIRKREPLHNEASHAADCFSYIALSVKQPKAPQDKPAEQKIVHPPRITGGYAPFG